MPRETISEFRLGIGASPGHGGGSFKAAADMLNIEIDKIGRPKSRLGYVGDGSSVLGDGDQIAKAHFAGNSSRPAVSQLFRFRNTESWVSENGRIIIAGEGALNRWIDMETKEVYRWINRHPHTAPLRVEDAREATHPAPPAVLAHRARHKVFVDIVNAYGDLALERPGEPTNNLDVKDIGWNFYGVCYSFYNEKFGIESPPSHVRVFAIEYHTLIGGKYSNTFGVRLDLTPIAVPEWATQIRIYQSTTPFLVWGENLFDTEDETAINSVIDIANTITRSVMHVDDAFNKYGLEFGLISTMTLSDIPPRPGPQTNPNAPFTPGAQIFMDLDWIRVGQVTEEQSALSTATRLISLGLIDNSKLEIPIPIYISSMGADGHDGLMGNYIKGTPPENLSHILLYAGRLWGWDPDTNSVRFSLIDGQGRSNYDIFPYHDTLLPHSISFSGPWQSEVTHLSVMPGKGGIYVFFRDAIRTIVGRALIKGLYSPDVSPQTDLDASGGIEGFGTLSPQSVIAFRSVTMFLGSDKTLYQISGENNPTDMGLEIQPWLDLIDDNSLDRVAAFGFDDKYHLILPPYGVFVLDIKRKYWTRFDWNITDAYWSSGGSQNESILYGLIYNPTGGTIRTPHVPRIPNTPDTTVVVPDPDPEPVNRPVPIRSRFTRISTNPTPFVKLQRVVSNRVSFEISGNVNVKAVVQDIQGRDVRYLFGSENRYETLNVNTGDTTTTHTRIWDGENSLLEPAAAGTYYVKVTYQDENGREVVFPDTEWPR